MSDKWTAEQYRQWAKTGKAPEGSNIPRKKKGKYSNRKTVVDGELVDSKLEAKHVREYRILLREGIIKAYSRQVEFMLPGGIKYIADHLIIHPDMSLEIVDSKGVETKEFKMKLKLMKEAHPEIKIRIRKHGE